MRILWIVNITMPDACEALGWPRPVIGGWLEGYQQALLQQGQDAELHVIAPGLRQAEVQTGRVCHHIFPQQWLDDGAGFASQQRSRLTPLSNQLAAFLLRINDEVRPDVVHLHGTELAHSLVWVEACGSNHTLVSIQGLTSVYARYYMGGLTREELKGCWSLDDWRWHRTLRQQQREMMQRGVNETMLLSRMQHVAGRTLWDRAHAWAINPQAQYHTLQEVLRAPFYLDANRWQLGQCQRHAIFVSQSHYPIKGLHRLLDALPLILRHYPDTQLYVVGDNRTDAPWYHRSAYVNVLRRKVSEASLSDHLHYLGMLSADDMIRQYRRAHVFVCPSAIENSCNSVCEAQLLGVPVVASQAGGMADLITDGADGLLYRYEEVEMLAQAVCRIFADDTLAQRLSTAAHDKAAQRHDRDAIAQTLLHIYNEISDLG